MLHQKEDVKIKIYLSSAVSFTLSRSSATQMLHPRRVKMLQGLKRELRACSLPPSECDPVDTERCKSQTKIVTP